MTVLVTAWTVIVGIAGTSSAAPGDQRLIQGTLMWPSVITAAQGAPEGFIIVRGDDGRTYYADVVVALRVRPVALQAGDRVEAVGVESGRPHVFTAVTVGPGGLPTSFPSALPRDVIAAPPPASVAPPPTPSASAAVPAPARDEAPVETRPRGPALQTVSGRVLSLSMSMLTLKTDDARVLVIDMSSLDSGGVLRAGDEVTIVGHHDPQRGFVARGLVQEALPLGSALPRQTR